MKKQINPNTKAHLIRSAFYVLLLLAVCVIPFALAQRNTPKRSVATKSKVTATKVAANKAQLMAARERAKSVPSSLIGKRQLAQPKNASDQAQLRYDVRRAPSLPRVSQLPLRSSGPTGAGPISVPPRPKGVQAILYDQYRQQCRRRHLVRDVYRFSYLRAPILLTTSLYPAARLGMWTRSTPTAYTSMAPDLPPIGMSLSTPTALAFPAHKFLARQTYQS